MITGIIEVTQDPEQAGSTLKILSLRLRGMKGQLQELGEETDENVENISKMQGQILNLTNGKVNIFDGAGEFRSTYEIMKDISEVWDDLNSTAQADLLETIAGKHRANSVAALMSNWENVEAAVKSATEAEGSAARENAKYVDSIQGRLDKLTTTWQSFANTFMSSDFLKGAISALTSFVGGLEKVIDTVGTFPALMTTVAAGFSLFKNKGMFTFDKDAKSIQLFGTQLTGLKDKYTQIQTAISRYNSLSSKSVSFQEKYNKAMQNSNTSFGKYISGLNGAKASMRGYIASLIGAKVASAALKVATMALNAALTMGISLLIDWAVSGIQKFFNEEKDLAEKVEELTSKFKEQHKELKKLKGDYDTSNESSMISKYEKLSKGVDNLGRNVSLTADEYSEYQSIVNQIADQIPSLVSGYDKQGNALLNVKGNVEELTAAYEKLIHAENQKILSQNSGNIEEDWQNTVSHANGYGFWETIGNSLSYSFWGGLFGFDDLENYDMKTDTAEWLSSLTPNTSIDEIIEGWRAAGINRQAETIQALQNAGYDVDSYSNIPEVLEEILDKEPQKIKNILDNYYASFDDAVAEYKTKATALLSEAFDVSSDISGLNYGNMSEGLQAIAYKMVNSLDFNFLSNLTKEGKTIVDWTKEMLDQLKTASELEGTSIEAAFDLETQFNGGEISFGKYVDGLVNVGKSIDGLVSNGTLDKEFATQIKLSIGLNEDGFIDEYERLRSRLAKDEYFSINTMSAEFLSFIEGLSSEELSVMWDVIPKLEKSKFKESINDVKSALELEMMLQGLTFDLDLEVETAGIEALNTAMAESVTGSGLSSESITALKGRYADLEAQGYDLSSMFEETSTGIRLNRQEFDKLEKAYTTDKLADIDSDLDKMKSTYDDIGEAIKNCDDPIRKSELFNDRQTLAKRISEAATLAHQYKGLANAYNDWLKAEEAGQERDMYEKIIEGFENVDDEISRGWVDDGTIKFLEMLTGRTDLAGKSGKQLKEVYDSLDNSIKYLGKDGKVLEDTGYSIRDFFTVDEDGNSTNTGVYNFLDAIGRLEEEAFGGKDVVKRDEDGNIIGFNFELAGGDEVIAETLGVSEELVQIMVRAADDAGFVISMDGTYRQLADLQNEAKAAADYLHQIGKTDFEFDFNTTSVENLKTQLEEAHKILDSKEFWNKDGTFNFNADGATQAMQVVSTLQAKLDKLTEEQYGIGLTVEDEEFEEPLENLQEYGRTVQTLNQLKLNPKVNADKIEELEGNLEDISKYFAGLDGDLKVELGLDADDNWEEVKKKIEKGEVKIPTVLDIQANMDKNIETLADLALLNSGLLSEDEEKVIKQKYTVDTEFENGNSYVDPELITVLTPDQMARQQNIEIIAETFGIEEVGDLSTKLKDLDDKTVQAIAEAIGKGDVYKLDEAVQGLEPNEVKAVANALGYDSVWELRYAVGGMQGNEVDAKANAYGKGEVDGLNSSIDTLASKDGTKVTITTVSNIIKNVVESVSYGGKKKAAQRTGANPDGKGGVNGTANVNGTAFKQGSWGTKRSGTALVGELGTEVLVRDGHYYTIGDNGAEFIKYRKGDIVFNHKQSEELFKNGKVTSGGGRAKALVNGTALASGSSGFGGLGKAVAKSVIKGVEKGVESTLKKKKSTSSSSSSNSSSNSSSSSNSKKSTNNSGSKGNGGVGRVEGTSAGSDKDKDKFEETIDFIEIAISRIEREIDNLDQKANNVYKSWSSRNKALADEISKVGEEIIKQNQGYDRYIQEANSIGLSETWAERVKNGTIDIYDENDFDEDTAKKIKEYQEWYEKALACKDAIEKLKETESELYAQRFENVQAQYDGILQGYEHTESMLNEYISQAEAKGYIVSKKYYDALISNEKQNISELKKEQADLIAERDRAVDEGKIVKGSEAWYDMCAEIDSVTQAIEEGATSLIEYNNAIRDIDWQVFDLIQERISDITAESEFLIELMSNKDLFDDNGKFTEQGVATAGLHALNYNTSMYQADEYGKEVAELDKQIAKDPYDQELINRRRELIELQRESILAAEDEKNAIKDLVEEGINLELDALQEKIDKKNEELEAEKDLYDYQRQVLEQTEEIASLEKQMAAYSNNDSEEAKAKIQELKVSLEEAKTDLQETEWDRYIDQQSQLMDTLYTEYETILNTRLDNIDYLIEQVIDGINAAAGVDGVLTSALGESGAIAVALGSNATTIGETLKTEVGNVGTKLSTAMSSIWSADGTGKAVIDLYGKDFQTKQTTTNEALNNIKTNVAAMVDDVDKEAQKKVVENKTQPSSKANPTKNTGNTNKPASNNNKSSGDGKAKVGDRVKFVSGKYYYDSQGKKPLGSHNLGKEVYITSISTEKWSTHPYHISTGKKLGSGDLGWLKLNQLSGYAAGKKKISNNEYAWTQEKGQEFIVRPSDGAILTPVAKNDSILNATASGNIWSMANNPAEFIKDNLGLDNADIPNGANVNNTYSQHIDNVVFRMDNVKNYEEMLSAMRKDKNFERLVLSMTIGRLAGESSLAKNKSIR